MFKRIIAINESSEFKDSLIQSLQTNDDDGYSPRFNKKFIGKPYLQMIRARINCIITTRGDFVRFEDSCIVTHCDDSLSISSDSIFDGSKNRICVVAPYAKIFVPKGAYYNKIKFLSECSYKGEKSQYASVRKFLEDRSELSKAKNAYASEFSKTEYKNCNIYFTVVESRTAEIYQNTQPVHLQDATMEIFDAIYRGNFTEKNSRTCNVCGTNKYPIMDSNYGMIKGKNLPSTGVALISHNDPAQDRRHGMEGNEISGICINCARKLTTGINLLLYNKNTSISIGDTNFIILPVSPPDVKTKTAPDLTVLSRGLFSIFFRSKQKPDVQEEVFVSNEEEVSAIERRKREMDDAFWNQHPMYNHGKNINMEILGLKPTVAGGRIGISTRHIEKYTSIDKRIRSFIENSFFREKNKKYFIPLFAYKSALNFDPKKWMDHPPTKNLIFALFEYIYLGKMIPDAIMYQLESAIRSDFHRGKKDFKKMALGRIIYNSHHTEQEALTMSINLDKTSMPYIAGRMFSRMAYMERIAYKEKKVMTIDGMRIAFAAQPQQVFEIIYRQYDIYKRIALRRNEDRGRAIAIDNEFNALKERWTDRATPYHGEDFIEFINGYDDQVQYSIEQARLHSANSKEE